MTKQTTAQLKIPEPQRRQRMGVAVFARLRRASPKLAVIASERRRGPHAK